MKLIQGVQAQQRKRNQARGTGGLTGADNSPPDNQQRRQLLTGAALGVGLLGVGLPARALQFGGRGANQAQAVALSANSRQAISWFDGNKHFVLAADNATRRLTLSPYSHGRALLALSTPQFPLVLDAAIEKLWRNNQLHNPQLSRADGKLWLSFAAGKSVTALHCYLACADDVRSPFRLLSDRPIAPGQELAVAQRSNGLLQLAVNDGSMLASSYLDIRSQQVAPWRARYISRHGHALSGIHITADGQQLTAADKVGGQLLSVGQRHVTGLTVDVMASRFSFDSRRLVWLTGEQADFPGKATAHRLEASVARSPAVKLHKESLV